MFFGGFLVYRWCLRLIERFLRAREEVEEGVLLESRDNSLGF